MCDRIVGVFTALYAQLNVSYDGFVPTSSIKALLMLY